MESHPFEWQDRSFRVTLSLGLTPVVKETIPSSAKLLELADTALYEAKREGKNQVAFYRANRLSPKEKKAAAA